MLWSAVLIIIPAVFVWHVFATADEENLKSRIRRCPLDRPNVILLFMDDLGYGDMGFTGHPTTQTPNLDYLAWNGKVLTTWYSACAACTGSRAALMTGRQWTRTGLPWVLGPVDRGGLPLNETTIAEHLKSGANYTTAIVGKWHLGQRAKYLPANRGFDYYLGIPYSDDMGDAVVSGCPSNANEPDGGSAEGRAGPARATVDWKRFKGDYSNMGPAHKSTKTTESRTTSNDGGDPPDDPARHYLPLVYQESNFTEILEQPLDFTRLAQKYSAFATKFVRKQAASGGDDPFFLYVPFAHVHVTSAAQPELQYAGCDFHGATKRGKFGDALAEADSIVGNILQTLREVELEENTLILFTSDNGPWLSRGLSAGSAGLFTGRYAGYYDTGKATTWEGGIRMPAFAYWPGQIAPQSRSAEIVSSLDVFPTLSRLAGLPLPKDRTMDGKDMTPVLLEDDGRSGHADHFLFFYGVCHVDEPYYTVTAVRHGPYKAHWCTGPGLHDGPNRTKIKVYGRYPLLFDVDRDPSESEPIAEGDTLPSDPTHCAAMRRIVRAYAMEKATFTFGRVVPYPDEAGEGPGKYGVCCDRMRDCNCTDPNGTDVTADPGWGRFLGGIGTRDHHDRYHQLLGEVEPSPRPDDDATADTEKY